MAWMHPSISSWLLQENTAERFADDKPLAYYANLRIPGETRTGSTTSTAMSNWRRHQLSLRATQARQRRGSKATPKNRCVSCCVIRSSWPRMLVIPHPGTGRPIGGVSACWSVRSVIATTHPTPACSQQPIPSAASFLSGPSHRWKHASPPMPSPAKRTMSTSKPHTCPAASGCNATTSSIGWKPINQPGGRESSQSKASNWRIKGIQKY